jgi:hypothetical protein
MGYNEVLKKVKGGKWWFQECQCKVYPAQAQDGGAPLQVWFTGWCPDCDTAIKFVGPFRSEIECQEERRDAAFGKRPPCWHYNERK